MAARRPLVLVDGQIRQMTVQEFNDLRWQMIPVGAEFPIDTSTPGVAIPPNDNPNYRYIKLTASDSYNSGALTSESVSGSAPLVQATAVINYAGSPMNGQTVRLINTERRFLRPGSSGMVEQDAMQNITGSISTSSSQGVLLANPSTPTGVFGTSAFGTSSGASAAGIGRPLGFDFDASRVARTSDETRVKSLGRDYFKRIH